MASHIAASFLCKKAPFDRSGGPTEFARLAGMLVLPLTLHFLLQSKGFKSPGKLPSSESNTLLGTNSQRKDRRDEPRCYGGLVLDRAQVWEFRLALATDGYDDG